MTSGAVQVAAARNLDAALVPTDAEARDSSAGAEWYFRFRFPFRAPTKAVPFPLPGVCGDKDRLSFSDSGADSGRPW
jgi:hypothetical protein